MQVSDVSDPQPVRLVNADLSRGERIGFGEAIFGEGKTPTMVKDAVAQLMAVEEKVLVTRATEDQFAAVSGLGDGFFFHETARVITRGWVAGAGRGRVSVISAGTTDLPVAEEAALTAEMLGAKVDRYPDVGVAGVHRLLREVDSIGKASIHIVVAGLEGALPSVVGGLVPGPIIAVPTSVGYGASFEGLSALLGMLNSCAPGVLVVNIDNGFGAGFAAGRWNERLTQATEV
jgi:NCAIR mutase (PurE)-related protein